MENTCLHLSVSLLTMLLPCDPSQIYRAPIYLTVVLGLRMSSFIKREDLEAVQGHLRMWAVSQHHLLSLFHSNIHPSVHRRLHIPLPCPSMIITLIGAINLFQLT